MTCIAHSVLSVHARADPTGIPAPRRARSGVQEAYNAVHMLHIMLLALCVALSLIFIFLVLRPTMGAIAAETKRVAQLFSCLPAEVDVEGMLARTLVVTSKSAADVQSALQEASQRKAYVSRKFD